jgi:hypothetical protein
MRFCIFPIIVLVALANMSTVPNHALAQSNQQVAVELVLAVDTSISVDPAEYHLQMQGIADAFRDPDIIDLITTQPGGVAVTVVHWSLGSLNSQAVEWQRLDSYASALIFAQRVEDAPRRHAGRGTSIGNAIRFSTRLITGNTFTGQALKIDISGDARSNSGGAPEFARDEAVALGITINGLTLATGDADLAQYFQDRVIGGNDAFVISSTRKQDFARAMRQKIRRELMLLAQADNQYP